MDSAIYIPILISLGSVSGALSRYYITLFFGRCFGTAFPYGTLFINLTGAFLMGLFATVISRLTIIYSLYFLVAVGFLGSYTTFSTYALDTSNLLRTKNDYKAALLYWLGTPILGFLSIEIGIFLGTLL
ncbi:chromosome condensation protein CrcB [Nostoc sp. ATCC 43529]|nr:chromosome condensation protein CrcB [Nostoc sp. ATCC 43529]